MCLLVLCLFDIWLPSVPIPFEFSIDAGELGYQHEIEGLALQISANTNTDTNTDTNIDSNTDTNKDSNAGKNTYTYNTN